MQSDPIQWNRWNNPGKKKVVHIHHANPFIFYSI